jgi:hypothetical protein
MNFWEQFAIMQGTSALHVVVRKYGAKYFTPEEMAAADVMLDALTQLPQRIHDAGLKPPQPPAGQP